MDLRHLLAALALTGCVSASALAQGVPFTESGPLNVGTGFVLQSEALSEEREVFVALPFGYGSTTKRYPVVYLLDAQSYALFQYAYGEVNALAAMGKIPEVILVGVPSEQRQLDMVTAALRPEGRADAFLDFLSNELLAFIDAQFRTEPHRILIGHSLGGAFALHALNRRPDAFDGYIAASPSLWVDGEFALREFRRQLAAGASFNHALFTSVADEVASFSKLVEDFVALIDETRPEGLELTYMTFPDEDHGTTILPAIHRGLMAMFERWPLPADAYSLEDLQAHYGSLSRHFGYEVQIPVEATSRIGLNLLQNKEYAAALELFEYSVANLAQGPNEYYLLGRALRALGRNEEALAAFERALELGSGSADYGRFIEERDAVVQDLSN